jgi:alpha-tubulin suppressor-like RCC1 family protein
MQGVSSATTMSAGEAHGLAIVGGGVVAWAHNRSGELGNGTTTDSAIPVSVVGLSNVVGIAAGDANSVAVLGDGSVWTWGHNATGELGNGSTTDRSTPGPVTGLGSGAGVVRVAAGGSHVLALKSDGTVLAWGNNHSGELGNGTTTDSPTPVTVSGLGPGSGVVAIAGGGSFSLALKSDGSVLAWGDNVSGELGNGTTTSSPTPVAVSGLGPGSGVVKIVGGGSSSYALHSSGALSAWGNNGAGELGDGAAPTDHHVPETVPGLPPLADIAAGDEHAVAVATSGAVLSWGDNLLGQLGDGTMIQRKTPVAVTGLGAGSGITNVFAGGRSSYAFTAAPTAPPTGAPTAAPASASVAAATTSAPAGSPSAAVPGAPKATALNGHPTLTG